MDSAKLPSDDLGKLIHVVEECAEVQKAITKLIRFGPKEYHPNDPKQVPNALAVLTEIDDLKHAIERVTPMLRDIAIECGWSDGV